MKLRIQKTGVIDSDYRGSVHVLLHCWHLADDAHRIVNAAWHRGFADHAAMRKEDSNE